MSLSFAAVACMRNEAIFVLEWLAHHILTGFGTVAVVTNDCDDGTDELVARLAAADARILHLPNEVPPGEAPQVSGMRAALADARLGAADYLLHCDADEFLHVSCGTGRVADLLQRLGNPDCVAIAWRPFGDSGLHRWTGGLVTETFALADSHPRPATALHKSLFRPARFGRAIDHMPKDPVSPDIRLVNTRGDAMNPRSLFHSTHARFRRNDAALLTWENACIHHYAIRSTDVFLMKNLRGDGMALDRPKYRLNSTFHRRYNRNLVPVPEARRMAEATRRLVEEFRTFPKIADLERQAYVRFAEARDRHLTPDRIAHWTQSPAHPQVLPS
jgi:hypothetical protein